MSLFTLVSPALPASAAPHPLLSKQRMLLVQGQPRFILGLYENPHDDAQLKEACDVQVYATSRRFEDPQARQGEVK